MERQEVWAAGVTYLRSKTARMEESDFSATAYDKVYAAERPEIFFKSLPEKVVATGEPVGIRRDATLECAGTGTGARAEFARPDRRLHHRQRHEFARHRRRKPAVSAAGQDLRPFLRARSVDHVGHARSRRRANGRSISIFGATASACFAGETSVGQIKRGFEELAGFLFRCQVFPHGAVLLTGTGIVPPDTFTLAERDEIAISISGVGTLKNVVVTV